MCKTLIAFATQKPSINDQEYTFHTSFHPIPLLFKPLPVPFWISFCIKQMLSRFSFILQHRETGEFRYHHASHNIHLLNSPKLILSQQDLYNLLGFLNSQDFSSHLKDQCPDTKLVTNVLSVFAPHLIVERLEHCKNIRGQFMLLLFS